MTDIALVWPKSTFLIDPMYYPPLGLWYVWTLLSGVGHRVTYYDMAEDALGSGHDQYWLSGTSPQLSEMKRVGRALRRQGKHVVLGGPHAWLKGGDSECFDVVVKGEVFTHGAVEAVLGASDPAIELPLMRGRQLDLPLPTRLAARRYHAKLMGRPCTTMMTSFGCPYHCAFCSSQDLWGPVRYNKLDNVLMDIARCSRLGFGALQFYDDILPIKKDRTLAIADALHKHKMIWRCFMRSDLGVLHGRDFLQALYERGLREVLVGVESASQTIKDNICKGTTVEQDTQLRTWCKEIGIAYKASVILGLPGETVGTLLETREWLLKNRPDKADINTLIPMPGTPLYDRPEEYDCKWTSSVPENYFFKGKPGDVTCLVETDSLTPEMILTFRNMIKAELAVPY